MTAGMHWKSQTLFRWTIRLQKNSNLLGPANQTSKNSKFFLLTLKTGNFTLRQQIIQTCHNLKSLQSPHPSCQPYLPCLESLDLFNWICVSSRPWVFGNPCWVLVRVAVRMSIGLTWGRAYVSTCSIAFHWQFQNCAVEPIPLWSMPLILNVNSFAMFRYPLASFCSGDPLG